MIVRFGRNIMVEQGKYEILENQQTFNSILGKGMLYADAFVNKHYLIDLDQYPVIEAEPERKSDDYIRLYHVERIVYDKNENANDKLISVYSAVYNLQSSCILVIRNHNRNLDFYLGIRSETNASTAEEILNESLKGNFPGSVMRHVEKKDITAVLTDVNIQNRFGYKQNVASVSIIPSARDQDKMRFVQGIEKFIDTMSGQDNFTAIFIAEPIDKAGLERHKQGLLELQTSLSPFEQTQLSYGVNESDAVSKGMSKNFSTAVNRSITDTNSTFKSKNKGKNSGWSIGLLGLGINGGHSSGFSEGNSWAQAVTSGTSETTGSTESDTETKTTGDTRTITVTNQNKSVQYITKKIDQHLERIRNCESFGMWDTACYFVSENLQTAVMAASTYKALMSGFESGIENSYVNVWRNDDNDHIPEVLESLRYCMHPMFEVPANHEAFTTDAQFVNPCCMISGNELPYIMGLPRKSVKGVTVLDIADFGRNVQYTNEHRIDQKTISFGQVFHMGMEEGTRVDLDLNSFTSHCFITGSTGSGKSKTTYRILDEMIEHRIPFLVVEPAKGEYKRQYGNLKGIHVFCTNPNYYSMLRLNPFKFPEQIHVLEHLDRLIEIFSACWPLYAAMPAILKDSFEQAYVRSGWDLENSIYISTGRPKYPTFRDVIEILPQVINSSEYSAESKGNYIGSLVTRVKSLTNGINGQVMCAEDEIDDSVLFDEYCIVDLSRVASLETKSLIMGVMIMKLNEYRMCSGRENSSLAHITVLEEAHNILKRTGGTSSSPDSADVQGKSVEMISSSIAEMRTFGEGFIIVDQSPTAVDVSAIKNTNTKIIMRLPDYDDCLISGKAIGLSDDQIHEISRFPRGVAAVYQNNWVESVLTLIDRSSDKLKREGDEVLNPSALAKLKGGLAMNLIDLMNAKKLQNGPAAEDMRVLRGIIQASKVTESRKRDMERSLQKFRIHYQELEGKVTVTDFGDQLAKLMECDALFDILPVKLTGDYSKADRIRKASITETDKAEIRKWYINFRENLNHYVESRDMIYSNKLIYYLICHMRSKYGRSTRYQVVFTQLYGE